MRCLIHKIGIVDLGTNSLRFDIYSISSSGRALRLHREKQMIRLGEGVFVRHQLSSLSKRRVLKTFKKISRRARSDGLQKIVCYGTSALRDATNTPPFLKQVHAKTGCTISVISGDHEAKLIALGLMHYHRFPQKTLLIDIGGGSTEFSAVKGKKIFFATSIHMGSMRLQNLYLKTHPPTPLKLQETREMIQKKLRQRFGNHPPSFSRAIGSAGTIKALLKITHSKNKVLKLSTLENLFKKIQISRLLELKKMLKTEGRRGDIIVAGTLLLIEILQFFRLSKISVTQRGLRDGILVEQLKLWKNLSDF